MVMPIECTTPRSDVRALQILAKSIHRELISNGYVEEDVMRLASALLDIVATETRQRLDRNNK